MLHAPTREIVRAGPRPAIRVLEGCAGEDLGPGAWGRAP